MKPISKFVSYSKIIIHMALLLLAAVLLVTVNRQSHQAIPAFMLPLTFEGVYSQDGGEWQTLDEHTTFNALEGDLVLKGTFGEEQQYLAEGTLINCYLDYIMMTVLVNGEVVYGGYPYSEDVIRDLCSKAWAQWSTPELGPQDEIEIRLHNPYRFGNANAYNEFLQMIYPGRSQVIMDYLEKQSAPYRVVGFGMVVCALVLLGMALASAAQRQRGVPELVSGGLMVLFAGGFFILDTLDISLRNLMFVVNSYGRQLCLILFVFELLVLTGRCLTGRAQKLAHLFTAVGASVDAVLLIVSLVTGRTLFGLMLPWTMIQVVLFAGMEILCVYNLWKYADDARLLIFSSSLMYVVLLLEAANAYTCWWQNMFLAKVVFSLLLFVFLVREIELIPQNYRAALREERLAAELKESRVKLSLGQIRSHFIYNVLTAINYTGQHDAQKASEAVECFVRYLRSNVDVLQNDKLIPFAQEMEHLRDYVALEKIHYDEEISFEEQLEEQDFLVPPLVLQPLVENAIHHGFDKMQRKGTIRLCVSREADVVTIVVEDDGEGFDQTKPMREGAVGVGNVQFRLKHMISGTMKLESRPGEGTRVTLTMPYRPVEAEQAAVQSRSERNRQSMEQRRRQNR